MAQLNVNELCSVFAEVATAKSAWYEQLRAYRHLRQQKCMAFWIDKVESERSHPAKLWESVDKLLSRGRTSACPSLSVEMLNSFFVEKVSKVRATTSSASAPTFSPVRDGVSLPEFSVLSVDVSSALLINFQTRAQRPIHSRHIFSSKPSTSSLCSLLSCSTGRWPLAIFRVPSRKPQLHRC